MPINLGIYSNIEKPDVGNALQAYATGMQARGQQQQNRLAAMQVEAAQRQQQQQDALNVSKAAAEEQNLRIERAAKVLTLQKSYATQVMAAPTLANALASLDSMEAVTGKGSMDSERARLTAIGDNPEQIRTWAAGHALDADKLLPHFSNVDTGGQVQMVGVDPITGQITQTGAITKTMAPGQAAQIRQTATGQAETARHNRASEEIARNAPGITYQTDANGNLIALPTKAAPGVAPVGVSVTGANGRPVQGKAALTETQGNALGFGLRAKEAQKLLNGYESRGIGPQGIVDRTINGLPVIGNSLIGEDQQAYNQAKQNFISAVLRKESGAAISTGEFANEDKKYFPQPGDGPKVLAQKQAARDMAIQALEIQSGRKLPDAANTKQPASTYGYATPQEAYADYVRARNTAYQAKNMDLVRRIDAEAKADGITK